MSESILITGAMGGIGRAIARHAAGARMSIGLLDLAQARDEAFEASLLAGGASAAHFEAFDLADVASHGDVVARTAKMLGPISHLVNNAGIGAPVRGDLLDMAPEAYDKVMGINLRGTFFLSQAVARHMVATDLRKFGSIVTVSSVSATVVSVERAEYCLSKSALPMMTQLFAARLAPHGVGVFEVRPGIIKTAMTERVTEKYDRLIAEGLVPAGRWGLPDDVAAAIAALWNPGMNFATGTTIDVGGGLSIARF